MFSSGENGVHIEWNTTKGFVIGEDMKKRVQAVEALLNRFRAHSEELGIKTLKLNPNTEIYGDDMPALVLTSGVDVIVKESNHSARGLPMIRDFTIVAELMVNRQETDVDLVRQLCLMRDIVFNEPYPISLDNGKPDRTTYFREVSTDGPFSYRVAYIEGVKLIIGLRYEDTGSY